MGKFPFILLVLLYLREITRLRNPLIPHKNTNNHKIPNDAFTPAVQFMRYLFETIGERIYDNIICGWTCGILFLLILIKDNYHKNMFITLICIVEFCYFYSDQIFVELFVNCFKPLIETIIFNEYTGL